MELQEMIWMEGLKGGCDRKVTGGKLFRVRLTMDMDGPTPKMADLRLLGDFFMHPEDSVEDLEEAICDAYNSGQDLVTSIHDVLDRKGAIIYGGGPEDISGAVLDAVQDALSKR
jgi:hypothetical protein